MKTRALIYIIAGVLCASVSVFAAYKYVSGASDKAEGIAMTPVLLAMRDIRQGEPLELTTNEGDGNVAFVRWPANCVPSGAVREREQVAESTLRALNRVTKHEVIQDSRVVGEANYVPPDMYLQMVKVGEEDLKSGRLRLGMKVDVLRIVDKRPTDFMKCVSIHAIGRLDENGLSLAEKEPPPNVWLLVKKEHRDAFVEAEFASKLLLVQSADSQCAEPQLIQSLDMVKQRREEAVRLLDRAKSLAKAGDHAEAMTLAKEVTADYSDMEEVAEQASVQMVKWRESAAKDLLKRARVALENERDYAAALSKLDRLERDFDSVTSVLGGIHEMRQKAEEGLQVHRAEVRFAATMEHLDACLAEGDIPSAESKLQELQGLTDTIPGGIGRYESGEAAAQHYERRVREAGGDFRMMKQALELFLNRGDAEAARAKLQQIKERFPAHPELHQLEAKVTDGPESNS